MKKSLPKTSRNGKEKNKKERKKERKKKKGAH